MGSRTHEPYELFEEPHAGRGRKAEMDMLDKIVQEELLRLAKSKQGPNIWYMSPPCNSFSDLMVLNKGTRTFQNPEGREGEQLHKEVEGNLLAEFIAKLYQVLVEEGKTAMVENSDTDHGRGLRYPKMWQTKWWKKSSKMMTT